MKARARLGGICRRTFYEHVRPHVPSISIGSRIFFDVDDLDAWADRQKALAPAAVAALGHSVVRPPSAVFGPGRRMWKVDKAGELVRVAPPVEKGTWYVGPKGRLVRAK